MGSLISSSEPGPSSFRKGAWSREEDDRLRKCIEMYGEGKWSSVPKRAGLKRCRKSCRLRWLNYLSPGIRSGKFADDEIDLIIRLHKLLGNRWSLIAGRIPGRTANGIKNFWNSHLSKKLNDQHEMIKVKEAIDAKVDVPIHIVKPQPLRLTSSNFEQDNNTIKNINEVNEHEEQWWNMNGSISGENQDKEVRLQETENVAPMSLQNYKFLSETEELLFQEIRDEDLFLGGVSEWEKLLQGGVCID